MAKRTHQQQITPPSGGQPMSLQDALSVLNQATEPINIGAGRFSKQDFLKIIIALEVLTGAVNELEALRAEVQKLRPPDQPA